MDADGRDASEAGAPGKTAGVAALDGSTTAVGVADTGVCLLHPSPNTVTTITIVNTEIRDISLPPAPGHPNAR